MKPHYFFSSVTRNSDLAGTSFETAPLERNQWATGDFVLGRVMGERNRLYECETKTGRMAELIRGDLLIGALGQRAATLEGVGDWHAIGDELLEGLDERDVGLGDSLEQPVLLQELIVFRMADVGQVRMEDQC